MQGKNGLDGIPGFRGNPGLTGDKGDKGDAGLNGESVSLVMLKEVIRSHNFQSNILVPLCCHNSVRNLNVCI